MSRILVVVERFYPEDFLVNDLVAAWKAAGDEVEVLTQVPSYPLDKIYDGYKNKRYQVTREFHDIPVYRVSTIFGYNKSVARKMLNYIHFGWRTFWWAVWHGKKYDRVFVYHTAALLMASSVFAFKGLWRKPISIWTQDLWPDAVWGFGFKKTRLREALLNGFVRSIYKRCDRIMVSCRGFTGRIKELCKRDAEFVPQWDTMPEADLEVARKRVRKPGEPIVFMFAGNLGKPQNLPNVLEGFAKAGLTDAELHFVGGGVMLEPLKETVEKDGIANVVFHGRQPRSDMPKWYAKADVLIISLTEAYELTLPGKFQSYIRTGKPLLGALLGDAKEMIDEEELGRTAAPGDVDAIAAAFREMGEVVRKGEGAVYGERGLRLSEREFNREALIKRLRGE